ncbi:MAG: hypothetical protein QW324_04345, partial [Thermofilaceae archaeon]
RASWGRPPPLAAAYSRLSAHRRRCASRLLSPSSRARAPWSAPGGLCAPIVIELPGEVEVESAEIRDGRLIIRSKGGEEIVLGEPTDMRWNPPRAERWYGFPLEAFREVLRFAGWKKRGWRERGLLESYCYLDVRGEKLYIGACGRMFFALLRGCEEEFRVSVKLSLLAEALEAFEMAGLKPGSIAFTRGERRAVLIQLRGDG